ncbi:hypothetical protein KKF97_17220, partial [Myxococcota bacterium]|nr:hypothetical protein [Myxococcota bacterium]
VECFSGTPRSGEGINHKQLWLDYLKTGELPFSPKELHQVIWDIVSRPENRPMGGKLLNFRKKYNFTLKKDKTPSRPEEALERFIIISNSDNFFNQLPIGGGKESIDLVIRHSLNSVEFVELKPWNSADSPLYALVEGLKNLIEYRIIVEQQIKEIEQPWKVDVSVLAPREYYQNFLLLDDSDTWKSKPTLSRTVELLDELRKEFNTTLTFLSFPLTLDRFNEACSHMYDRQGLTGQQVASVSEADSNVSLNRTNWTCLISSRNIG